MMTSYMEIKVETEQQMTIILYMYKKNNQCRNLSEAIASLASMVATALPSLLPICTLQVGISQSFTAFFLFNFMLNTKMFLFL